MSTDNIRLTGKEKVAIAIEAGIGAIPCIGGPLQTLYFGNQNEKRFKRIEKFYYELNTDLEKIKDSIPSVESVINKDDFLGVIEELNNEIEKSKTQSKIDYFKNFYKKTLLTSDSPNFDVHYFFLEALSNLTNLELHILVFLNETSSGNGILGTEISREMNLTGVHLDLINGSLNRLINYGLVSSFYLNITPAGPSDLGNNKYSINSLGHEFSLFILEN